MTLAAPTYLLALLAIPLVAAAYAVARNRRRRLAVRFPATAVFARVAPAQSRLRRIQLGLPHVVDLLTLSLGAGLDFPASVRQVVEKASRPDEPLMEELGLVLHECNLGRTRREALEKFAARAPCEPVRELVASVVQSEEQGTPLAAVLKVQASCSRARRGVSAEESASRAGTALMIPLVLLFACILLLIMAPMFMKLGPALGG